MTQHKSNKTKIKPEKRPPKKITESYLHNSGLYYLERFAASQNHFKSVMLRKIKKSCHFHEDQDYASCVVMLEKIIEIFVRSGLLNDDLYAKGIAQNLRKRGQSKNATLQKMCVKGIDKSLAIAKLNEVDEYSEDPEFQAALRLTQRKRIGLFSKTEEHDLKKWLPIMARAGFSYELAIKALKYKPENDDTH